VLVSSFIEDFALSGFFQERSLLRTFAQRDHIQRNLARHSPELSVVFHGERIVVFIGILKYGDIQVMRVIGIHKGSENDHALNLGQPRQTGYNLFLQHFLHITG
jgi:hypothetical protein